ncbi:carboxylesterase family protein [Streptomyces sp. NPDC002044]|uniref:carboxylesterase family protein n=1 Tax=Streptomyces sp. NPDC002044 TaxID=3154662 RepID=UPI003333B875
MSFTDRQFPSPLAVGTTYDPPDGDGALVVGTSSGDVHGFLDRGVPNWRGVPYGRIPERFRPPVAATRAGPVDAREWGPVSWQVPMAATPGRWSPLYPDAVKSEECLNLNIWSAHADRSRPKPVLVWFHPGRHMVGGNMPTVDPWTLAARHDVVVVSANFRLGPWGWLHLGTLDPEFADSLNLAVRDQLLMLRWVRDNIAGFGGDPGNVTIFGLSTGGSDVATLLSVPAARGLFHKAAVYSGTAEHTIEPAQALATAERFLDAAGSLVGSAADLRRLSNVALRHIHLKALRAGPLQYEPVVDGDLVPESALRSLARGGAAGVPLLLSVTSDEARILDLAAGPAVDDKCAALAGPGRHAPHDEKLAFLSRTLYYEPMERLLATVHGAGGTCWAQVFDYHPTTSHLAGNPAVAGRAVHGADTAALFGDAHGSAGDAQDRTAIADVQQGLIELAGHGRPSWPGYSPHAPLARWITAGGPGGTRLGPLP